MRPLAFCRLALPIPTQLDVRAREIVGESKIECRLS